MTSSICNNVQEQQFYKKVFSDARVNLMPYYSEERNDGLLFIERYLKKNRFIEALINPRRHAFQKKL